MNYVHLLLKLYILKRNTKKTQKQIKKLQEKKLKKILNMEQYSFEDCYLNSFISYW